MKFSRLLMTAILLIPMSVVSAQVDPLANPPNPAFEGQTSAPEVNSRVLVKTEVIVSDLQAPRALAPLPDGYLLIAEGAGRVLVLDPDGNNVGEISGMPAIRSVAGRSLNDFIIDANFAENRRVYMTYMAPPAGEPGGSVSPAVQAGLAEEGLPFQIPQIATGIMSQDHLQLQNLEILADISGRRMVSSSDGKLYITTMGYGESRPEVQQLDNYTGKVLRINSDGSIPADNPYLGVDGALPELYAIGHRDPDGAFLHPQTGELWTIQHGPMGGDELNIIRAGENGGWPEVTYGKNYDGTEIGPSQREGTIQPLYYWFPSVAPSGLMMYSGDTFPQWQGDIFLGTMSPTQGKFLVRLELNGERVVAVEHLLVDRDRRIRDVAQAADGSIYVLTDSEDNEQTNRHFVGEVLKLSAP